MFRRRSSTDGGRKAKSFETVTLLEGQHVYAIGDVHGCLRQLKTLLNLIDQDRQDQPAQIVFLGDLIDRGPDSAGVLDKVVAKPKPGITRHCLLGNHEDAFRNFLQEPSLDHHWMGYGAEETLASYGIYAEAMEKAGKNKKRWQYLIDAHIPQRHIKFLNTMPRMAVRSGYAFVHAGIDPTKPLDEQDAEDLIWIREPFLSYEGPTPACVVHGHTPAPATEVLEHRINVDTGCYETGRLSAVRIDPNGAFQLLHVAGA